jgi:type IV secretion system protein VirD4
MSEKRNNAVGPQVRMGPQKANRGLLALLVLASIVGALWAATQHFARSFNYHPALGENSQHLYMPWKILVWASQWYSQYPGAFVQSGTMGTVVLAIGIAATALVKFGGKAKGNPFLHGSARWADKKDIADAGLLENGDGVYVGAWRDKAGKTYYLRHSGPEHVLTYAPTRSGKGVGLVIPTLLSWPASAVIADLKGELWELTAGWRHKHAGNDVIRFEPASVASSAKWNPLDEIRMTAEHQVGDVQNLATLIVDPDGRGLETHWQKTGQALLIGVIMHALLSVRRGEAPATLAGVERMLSDPSRPVSQLWAEMRTSSNPVVSSAGQDMLDRPDEEAGSVLSTAKSYLSVYRDPVVAGNTRTSEFRIRDLMNSERPMSLYIITQPNDKTRLRPLVRIMLNMIVRLNADKLVFENGQPQAMYKHRLLAMIDEFPSLGKLSILQESLAFLASYGIKFYLICQDINQLKSREDGYGPDETITSNCHIQNAFPPNRIETAEHLSRLTGQTTIVKEQVTTTGGSGLFAGPKSRTMQEVQRPLLTPDECLRMPGPKKDREGKITEPGDMVIYVAGYPAIYGRQPLFFADPVFAKRASVPPPLRDDRIGAKTAVARPQRRATVAAEIAQ